MAHPKKGTHEAKAWAAKMQAARKKKATSIRSAGLRTEQEFFGPRGVFAKAGHVKHFKSNPLYFVKSKIPTVALFAQSWLSSTVTLSGKSMPHYGLSLIGYKDSARHEIFVGYDPTREEYVVYDPAPRQNPGQAWHEGMEQVAARYSRSAREPMERAMFKGIEVAHRDSAKAARRLGMNRPKERTILPRVRKNPLAVFGLGNPPKHVSVGVAGVLYSRCLEIRAEKLKYKPGLYKHPFTAKAGVQILALDSGDLLVHSTRGVNLWEPV